MGGAYFPPNLELTSWPAVSGTDQSANLRLPLPALAFGTAQIAASTASTPQFFDTSYSDSEMDVMSNVHSASNAGGDLLMPAVGPEQHIPYGQQDSIRGKASASKSTSNEGSRTKLQHTGRSKSGSAEGAGNAGSKKEFTCSYQFCKSPAFTRMADLERHMKHVHLAADKKERFFCDYSGCSRSSTPFHRKDHYREHLREYHLEDLLKRGSNAHRSMSPNTEAASLSGAVDHETNKKMMQEMQLQNCNIDVSWWRCARCLKRVKVADRGWSCPDCKGSIEEPRKALRASRLARNNAVNPPNVDSSINLPTAPTWSYEQLPLTPYE
ncbi:hypothetical protein SEPCBS57363_006680 [Sporothrix epigloea]|uniref:C2H2-type domain-containing protein n=1 Tax=Sporothrix epigloea TaxID=1892477 RepID=A0ABP0E4U7_9PEZI